MKRRLVNLLTALSLVLCVVVCVMWVRSYAVSDYVIWRKWPRILEFEASAGEASVVWGIWAPKRPSPDTGWRPDWGRQDPHHVNLLRDAFLGFSHRREQWQVPEGRCDTRGLTVPYWALVAATAAAPFFATARRWRVRRRRAAGRCPACGYDLIGNVSGVCPECGMKMT